VIGYFNTALTDQKYQSWCRNGAVNSPLLHRTG